MLDNLEPAEKIPAKQQVKPGIEFDGYEGHAVTHGYESEPENFDEFLRDAGLDPDGIEVIPPIKTSRWQQSSKTKGTIWLTAYKFTFRRKTAGIDLPVLMSNAFKIKRPKYVEPKTDKCLVVLWSDLQVGKVDYRGNSETLIDRVHLMQDRLIDLIKREKPSKVIFADTGDVVENFSNAASMQQLRTNDLSIMEQVDLATTFAWETLKAITALVEDVQYVSIGSNHCQWRVNGQTIGKPTDDWGVFIGRQLARLADQTNTPIRFIEPQPWDETLAVDVFGDGFHILGLAHGHQVSRPESVVDWWKKQSFGNQSVAQATVLATGHFHHVRVVETGATDHGNSRYWVQASTMDNGSGWYKKTSGDDSVPGLVTFFLERDIAFTGTIYKL